MATLGVAAVAGDPMGDVLGAALFVVSAAVSAYLTTSAARRSPGQRKEQMDVVVDALTIYPVKGCGPIYLQQSALTARGLLYDREFMVVDTAKEGKRFMSQRQYGQMALISTAIDFEQLTLTLTKRDDASLPALVLSLQAPNEAVHRTTVTVWKDACPAVDCGAEANAWINRALSASTLSLVRMALETVRLTSKKYSKGQNSFSDGFPFLLASTESLQDLNSRLVVRILEHSSSLMIPYLQIIKANNYA
jgi:uncharacterized protein YcbX